MSYLDHFLKESSGGGGRGGPDAASIGGPGSTQHSVTTLGGNMVSKVHLFSLVLSSTILINIFLYLSTHHQIPFPSHLRINKMPLQHHLPLIISITNSTW